MERACPTPVIDTISLRDDRLAANRPLASALPNCAVASGRPARYPIYGCSPLKVGKTTECTFSERIRELVAGHPGLELVAKALLEAHAVLRREFNGLDKRTQKLARSHPQARLLMTTPSVGPIVALTYASAIDDPNRFRSSKATGAHFGLTPKKYQSGQTDYTGRISKIGDASVREALYQAAHVMLTKPIKGCSALKSWAMRISKRAGMRKAKVALARKLAVILHRMLADAKPFNPTAKAAAT